MPLTPAERCIAKMGLNPKPFREKAQDIMAPIEKFWKSTTDLAYEVQERIKGKDPIPVRVRDAFARFDGDGNGHVDTLELKLALGTLGYDLDYAMAESILKRYDDDNNETLELEEFYQLVMDFEGIGSKKIEDAHLEDDAEVMAAQQAAREKRLSGADGPKDVRRLSMYIEEGITGYTPRDEGGFMQSRRQSTGSEQLVTFLKDLGVTMKTGKDAAAHT